MNLNQKSASDMQHTNVGARSSVTKVVRWAGHQPKVPT